MVYSSVGSKDTRRFSVDEDIGNDTKTLQSSCSIDILFALIRKGEAH